MWKTYGTKTLGNTLDESRSDYFITLPFSFQFTSFVESSLPSIKVSFSAVHRMQKSFTKVSLQKREEKHSFLQYLLKYPLLAHITDFKQNTVFGSGS